MSLFVKVVNEEVREVWDTQPPSGEAGWSAAVEVRPSITANRQMYTSHSFDLTKDPVEIVYAVADISVSDRKKDLISKANFEYQEVVNVQTRLEIADASGDMDAIIAAKTAKDSKIAAINNCSTHDELDDL